MTPDTAPHARILIVEDDAGAAHLLQGLLRLDGHQVVGIAADGDTALRLAASTRPDLVIMDIVLPGRLDGIETAAQLTQAQDLPVLYVTGHADEALFERARATAPLAFLSKPFDEHGLRYAVELALDRHALLRRLRQSEARLEQAVAARTAELSATNARLQAEIEQRRRLEETRRKAERAAERFRLALDASPDEICLIDPRTLRILDVNATACASLGYSREELLELSPQELKPDAGEDALRRRFADLLAGLPGADILRTRRRRRDGSTFPVELRLRAFRASGRDLVVAVVRDISEQVRREAELQETEERFRQLAQSIDEAIWIRDLDADRVLYVSPTYERLLGQSVTELYQDPRAFLTSVHAEDRQRASAVFEQMRSLPENLDTEFRIVVDGRVRWLWVRSFPILDAQGRMYRRLGLAKDITERRQAEERYQTILQAAMDAFWIVDLRGHVVECNEAACRMLGYEREALLALTVADIDAIESPRDTRARIQGIVARGTDRFETRHRCKDGREIDVEASVQYLAGDEGGYMFAFFRDISARKRQEEERIAHENAQRDALVREVHHRIKNNLQGVVGLLRQHVAEHPESRAVMESAIAQVNTIAVVHGLQGRMRHGGLRLRELLVGVANAAASLAVLPHQPPVADTLEGDIWLENGTAVSIALILNELIHNAIKHGKPADGLAIALRGRDGLASLRIVNGGGPLPAGFDLATGRGCGTGLDLVRTLLPRRGAALSLREADGHIVTELSLAPPLTTAALSTMTTRPPSLS